MDLPVMNERASIRRSLPWRLAVQYVNGPAPHYAPAIAFNAFVAIFPIIVGVVSVLLLLFPGQTVPRQVDRLLVEAFPLGTRREIAFLLREIPKHLQTAAIVSLLAMVWSGTALFSCLGGALNAVHGTRGRNVLRQRLVGLRLFGVLTAAVAVLLLLDSLSDQLPHHPLIGALVALGPLTMLMAFIYRMAPNHHAPVRRLLPGALIAAILIEAVTMAFPLYSRISDTANTYGRGLALALVTLFWLYLVSHIVLVGATLNEVRSRA